MSIASASLVPTLPVNGIQFLNPALASSSLSTDANGNVVAGGGSASNSSTITIRVNPSSVINQVAGTSRCEFVKSGNLVNFVAQITFGIQSVPTSVLAQYYFSVDGLNNPMQNFTNSTASLPINQVFYGSAIYDTSAQTVPIILQNNSYISLSSGVVGALDNLAILLDADLSTLNVGANYILLISGFYFSQ
jgi:hypothetical protein